MKTIEEKNRMIAEFMGKEIYQKYHESHYHTSWDWLMPVVEKIINECDSQCMFEAPGYLSLEYKYQFELVSDCKAIQYGQGDTMIEAVYEAVVKYIKAKNK